MKVAILISGQPRNYEQGYAELKKAYLDRYDCDVFFHTWDDTTFEATQFFPDKKYAYSYTEGWKHHLLDLYQPTMHLFETPIVFDESGFIDPLWRQPLQNTKSMFYSIWKAFDVFRTHQELRADFFNTYDVCIRTRFDLRYEPSTLNLESLDMSNIHVWKWDTDERVRHKGVYDVFAVGGVDSIGIYSSAYHRLNWMLSYDRDYIDHFIGPQDSPLRNEYLLKWHLLQSGVVIEEHPTVLSGADSQIIR